MIVLICDGFCEYMCSRNAIKTCHIIISAKIGVIIQSSKTTIDDAGTKFNVEELVGNQKTTILNKCKSAFSFVNAGYSAFSLSTAISMLPFLVPFLYFPDVALERGVTKQEAAFIASSMGIGSLAGRAGF